MPGHSNNERLHHEKNFPQFHSLFLLGIVIAGCSGGKQAEEPARTDEQDRDSRVEYDWGGNWRRD